MRIRFIRNDLHQIDRVAADTFIASIFEEEKPPRGVAGLLDWRMCGRVSSLLVSGTVTGRWRESTLFPAYRRVPASRICVFGLGRMAEFTPARAREACWFIADALQKLRAGSLIGSIPGSPLAGLPARARLELFLEELLRVFGPDDGTESFEAILVEPVELHRDLSDVVTATTRKLKVIWK